MEKILYLDDILEANHPMDGGQRLTVEDVIEGTTNGGYITFYPAGYGVEINYRISYTNDNEIIRKSIDHETCGEPIIRTRVIRIRKEKRRTLLPPMFNYQKITMSGECKDLTKLEGYEQILEETVLGDISVPEEKEGFDFYHYFFGVDMNDDKYIEENYDVLFSDEEYRG